MAADRNEKKGESRLRSDLRDLFIIAVVFIGFLVVAILYIPRLPQPFLTIAYILALIVVGTVLKSLAK